MTLRARALIHSLMLLEELTRKGDIRIISIDECGELPEMIKTLETERRYMIVEPADDFPIPTHYIIPREPHNFGLKSRGMKKFQSMKAKSR